MNVPTISMPKDVARAKFDEYVEALRDRAPTAEDTATLLGYKALANGKELLDLFKVFRETVGDGHHRPRFAIARAHWTHVAVSRSDQGSAIFQQTANSTEWVNFSHRCAWHRRIRLPVATIHESARPISNDRYQHLRAIVPTIPPKLRPRCALHRYVILWEAEWQKVPPTDPFLLRQIAGPLYALLAAWDLTELERTVLSGRLET